MAKKINATITRTNENGAVWAMIDGKETILIRRIGDKKPYAVGDSVQVVLVKEMRTIRATGPMCSVQFSRSVDSGRSHYHLV